MEINKASKFSNSNERLDARSPNVTYSALDIYKAKQSNGGVDVYELTNAKHRLHKRKYKIKLRRRDGSGSIRRMKSVKKRAFSRWVKS